MDDLITVTLITVTLTFGESQQDTNAYLRFQNFQFTTNVKWYENKYNDLSNKLSNTLMIYLLKLSEMTLF